LFLLIHPSIELLGFLPISRFLLQFFLLMILSPLNSFVLFQFPDLVNQFISDPYISVWEPLNLSWAQENRRPSSAILFLLSTYTTPHLLICTSQIAGKDSTSL
jgi:hypothetical protein